jgi:hypothetical protein
MDSGSQSVVHQLGQDRHRSQQLAARSGNQAGKRRRSATGPMESDRAPGIDRITGGIGAASPAVYVDVNETGYHELFPEISRDLSGRLSTACLGDPAVVDPQPTRSHNLAAADHSSSCDHLLGQHNADVSAGDRIRSADAEDVRSPVQVAAETPATWPARATRDASRLRTANEGSTRASDTRLPSHGSKRWRRVAQRRGS